MPLYWDAESIRDAHRVRERGTAVGGAERTLVALGQLRCARVELPFPKYRLTVRSML